MIRLATTFRSILFLGWLSFALGSVAVGATIWALHLSATVASMTASAAATALAHRKELAAAVARTKAKARLRRIVVAVPVIGLGAIAVFEEQDFQEWHEENPEGTRQDYACEVALISAELVDEVLQGLPEMIRPAPDTVLGVLPACE